VSLPRSFYQRPALRVARDVIGKVLIHLTPEGPVGGRIVESEAYQGPADQAAHSRDGRRTARTEVMFGAAGHAYMFLLYGMHWAFNIVVADVDVPHAVLIRAIEPTLGIDVMAQNRNVRADARELTNGPGKVCAALGLNRAHYGMDLCGPTLFLDEGPRVPVGKSERINVDYAGTWALKHWRFHERGNRYVSVAPRD